LAHTLNATAEVNLLLKVFKSRTTVEHEISLSVNRRAVLANLAFKKAPKPHAAASGVQPPTDCHTYFASGKSAGGRE
jgi:hypothetical protein